MKKSLILLTITSTIIFSQCSPKKQAENTTENNVVSASLSPTSLYDVDKKVFDFKEITAKHKVTYVDFWASWCGPCRGEMPASQQLRETYKDKDVNFVYISLDEEASDWTDANAKFALPSGHSFLIPRASESAIPAQFNLNSIPRYLLIDSTGTVVDDNAPRPSESSRIRETLDRMLK